MHASLVKAQKALDDAIEGARASMGSFNQRVYRLIPGSTDVAKELAQYERQRDAWVERAKTAASPREVNGLLGSAEEYIKGVRYLSGVSEELTFTRLTEYVASESAKDVGNAAQSIRNAIPYIGLALVGAVVVGLFLRVRGNE